MSQPERYDILVLGSGAGGKLLAWHLARSGRRTAVVERRYIGGSCPNIACLPSKNEIWSAKVAHLARHGAQFGVVTGVVTTDMAIVVKRKRDIINVGTHTAIPPVPGLEAARPLTHIEALELDYAPAHLIVLGAGYIGL